MDFSLNKIQNIHVIINEIKKDQNFSSMRFQIVIAEFSHR